MKSIKAFGKRIKVEKPVKSSAWYSQEKRDLISLEIEELTDSMLKRNQSVIDEYRQLARI